MSMVVSLASDCSIRYTTGMRHIGQQTLPSISHHGDIYTIHDIRDYTRYSEDAPKEQYISADIPLWNITGCRIYQSTFGYSKHVFMLAHCMVWFLYKNAQWEQQEVIFSIEARRPAGESYKLRKWVIPWMYKSMYTWGTPSDLLSLRKHVWHDPLESYDLTLSAKQTQDLFVFYAHRTNNAHHENKWYNAIRHNCLSDLHRGIAYSTKKLSAWTIRSVFSTWYISHLKRKGLIKS